jgi:AcrR family transcriptional regulator
MARKTRTDSRDRILAAAAEVFLNRGFSRANTLEIASRARVSKRELYALFESKQALLEACIRSRAERMRVALELPDVTTREALGAALTAFGCGVLREVSQPAVIGMFRLAIAEADHSPELARTLDQQGRTANRRALSAALERAQASGLVPPGHAPTMAAQFLSLLWDDLHMRLLLGVTAPLTPEGTEARSRMAAETFLKLYDPRDTRPRQVD